MINLILYSMGNSKYTLLYPTPLDYITVPVVEMSCSSSNWAVIDVQEEMGKYMDELFGENNWCVHYAPNIEAAAELEKKLRNGNDLIPLNEYYNKRRQYHLPPWENEDKLQFPRFI